MRFRLLYYALGGGYGHVTRSLHALRALDRMARGRFRCALIAPARASSVIEAAGLPEVEHRSPPERLVALCSPSTMDLGRSSLGEWLQNVSREWKPHLTVVDTFPRGLLGEFAPDPGELRMLVLRATAPAYLRLPKVREALGRYSKVCLVEGLSRTEEPSVRPSWVQTAPVVNPLPPLPRPAARALLGADRRPLVLGLGSGSTPEQLRTARTLQSLGEREGWDVRWLSRELGTETAALGALLPAADAVVSASGYNTYYEVLQAGVPAVWRPQRRRYDDQTGRALGRFAPPRPLAASAVCLGEEWPEGLCAAVGQPRRPQQWRSGAWLLAEEMLKLARGSRNEQQMEVSNS